VNWTRLSWRSGGIAALALSLGLWLVPGAVEAVSKVDCDKGQKVQPKVKKKGVVIVKGHCTENLVIVADDVTITTDGVSAALFSPADAAEPTISLNGANRVVIDGAATGGITVNGGTPGILARGNSTLTLMNCAITGTSQNGVVAGAGSTVAIDACAITGNGGNGAVAANTSSLIITNSTVTGNTGSGLGATRSAYLRVGQDSDGTATVKPVTVSGNGANGIFITESSSGTVVGGVVETSTVTNIFVGRGSSGQIGVGLNGLTAGVAVQNGASFGISVEGANATIAYGTVANNARAGIIITNAGSARIGILNGNTGYGPVTITGNGGPGVHVAIGGSAFIGGTTVGANGTVVNALGRYGIGVQRGGSVALAGDNVIENNPETGIFVGGGSTLLVGDGAFGLSTGNTISGNGGVGPNTGGLFAFQGGVIQVNDATISDNTGPGLQAFEGGIIELRGASSVTVPAAGSTNGATVNFASRLRVRDTASIVSATADGIQVGDASSVNVRDATSVVQGNGASGVGVRCTNTSPLTKSASTLTGNLTGVTGTVSQQVGCNLFPS